MATNQTSRVRYCDDYSVHDAHDWFELNLMWECPGVFAPPVIAAMTSKSNSERTLYYKHLVSVLRHDDTYVVDEPEARQALADVIPNHWDHGEIESAGFDGDWFIRVNQAMHDELSLDEENVTLGLSYWIAVAE